MRAAKARVAPENATERAIRYVIAMWHVAGWQQMLREAA